MYRHLWGYIKVLLFLKMVVFIEDLVLVLFKDKAVSAKGEPITEGARNEWCTSE